VTPRSRALIPDPIATPAEPTAELADKDFEIGIADLFPLAVRSARKGVKTLARIPPNSQSSNTSSHRPIAGYLVRVRSSWPCEQTHTLVVAMQDASHDRFLVSSTLYFPFSHCLLSRCASPRNCDGSSGYVA
jgi:hypothetical protein